MTRGLMVLLATVAVVLVTAVAGRWQLARGARKEALQALLQERMKLPPLPATELARDDTALQTQRERAIRLQGTWLPGRTFFLDNRPMDGRAGFIVVTPLLLAPGDAVLVQRGWVARDAQDRSRVPPVATPAGLVEVAGRVVPPPGRTFELSHAQEHGPIRQNIDPAELSVEIGVPLRPLSVLQTEPDGAPAAVPAASHVAADGLLRHWPLPAVDVQKHYAYAAQWFAMSATALGLYVWFQIIQPRRRQREHVAA